MDQQTNLQLQLHVPEKTTETSKDQKSIETRQRDISKDTN